MQNLDDYVLINPKRAINKKCDFINSSVRVNFYRKSKETYINIWIGGDIVHRIGWNDTDKIIIKYNRNNSNELLLYKVGLNNDESSAGFKLYKSASAKSTSYKLSFKWEMEAKEVKYKIASTKKIVESKIEGNDYLLINI